MRKIVILVSGLCLALVGFSERVMAGPLPVSAQEGLQLGALAHGEALLAQKAGGSFPNAPRALEATEESSLRTMEAGSPDLTRLKAGDGAGTVLVWAVVIVICVILLRAIGV